VKAFEWIAEQRIIDAMERGDFENLPGARRPLSLDRDASVPDEMWLALKILKDAGVVQPEIEDRKEIRPLEDFLAVMEDGPEKTRAVTRLSLLQTKLETSRRRAIAMDRRYHDSLATRLTRSRGR